MIESTSGNLEKEKDSPCPGPDLIKGIGESRCGWDMETVQKYESLCMSPTKQQSDKVK